MKFVISREALLKPLNLVAGVVERRQTLPILSNVLLQLEADQLSITGTDLEVELVGRVTLDKASKAGGAITVPARKLADICKSLPDDSDIEFTQDEQRVVVKSGRSRFTLSTLAANDFPSVEESPGSQDFTVKQGDLKRLIDRTSFAMAQQDVRYYLNGMLWEVSDGQLRMVATDGHRLLHPCCPIKTEENQQVIMPRKGIVELARLLMNENDDVRVVIGSNHIRATTAEFTLPPS